MNLLIVIVALLIGAAFQATLPSLSWLGGVRLELLPALVVYCALTFRRRTSVPLAIAAGLMQDSLSAAPFGVTALVSGIAALIMGSLREVLVRDLFLVQIGAAAFTAAATSCAACCVIGFSVGAIVKLLIVASLGGLLAPTVFVACDFLRLQAGEIR